MRVRIVRLLFSSSCCRRELVRNWALEKGKTKGERLMDGHTARETGRQKDRQIGRQANRLGGMENEMLME